MPEVDEMTTPKEAALGYATHGIRVFPIQPNDKRPFPGSHGCLDATTDTDVITRWWTDHPDANVAIATGAGLVVIDIDIQTHWGDLEGVPDRGGHGISADMLIEEMTADGFRAVRRFENWPGAKDQLCVVFEVGSSADSRPTET